MITATGPTTRLASPSAGFTSIELLVVVSIIGLLMALILPAVQSARETARRMQCISNLRQLGIALQSYHAEANMFPPGGRTRHLNVEFQYSALSSIISILPHLEQRTLFDSVNLDLASQDSAETPIVENATARRTTVAVFLCPSDSESNHRMNYRLNRGIWTNERVDVGPFVRFFVATQASVTDGLSRTAFASERLGGDFIPGSHDPRRNFLNSFAAFPAALGPVRVTEDEYLPICLADPSADWVPFAGRYWLYYGDAFTLYHHLGQPNDRRPSCIANYLRPWPGYGFAPPRSNHPGGVNVLFGDGHVEWVKDSINEAAWKSLGTPASGD